MVANSTASHEAAAPSTQAARASVEARQAPLPACGQDRDLLARQPGMFAQTAYVFSRTPSGTAERRNVPPLRFSNQMHDSQRLSPSDTIRESSTIVVGRVVHPGRERQFDRWAREIDAAARRYPGHLGNVRLSDSSGINYLVYRFDSPEHLHAWEASGERRKLVAKGDEISDEHRDAAVGMDAWFAIAGKPAAPKWKTFLVTWLAVYPVLLSITFLLNALLPALERPVQLALSSALLTSSLTWIIMPLLTRQLRPWLLRGVKQVDRLSDRQRNG
ncbi:hypothetical protein [Burkholderia sp. MSMB1459WGS]|uniref:hypothetical protein n=2 Tax=unclassified Burkholderia TaxID=2613784 RepID=UPI00211D53B9|nr:hypothetical protein [Burkholderia sp. MSMB1459WGS]